MQWANAVGLEKKVTEKNTDREWKTEKLITEAPSNS